MFLSILNGVILGAADAAGLVCGEAILNGEVIAVSTLRIIGGGLPIVPLLHGARSSAAPPIAQEMWSRTIGALSEAVWLSLRNLRIALFGCGRSGSLMANALIRNGVKDLSICDADRLEIHNCGEMDLITLSDAVTGRFKAEAVSYSLRELALPEVNLRGFARSATSMSGLLAAKGADLVITCVDNPAARLAAGLLAQVYLKPCRHRIRGCGFAGADGRGYSSDAPRPLFCVLRSILVRPRG